MDIFVHDLIYHPIGSSAIRSVAFRRFIIMWMWYFFSTKMVDAIWSRKTFYTLILWCLFHFFKYRYVIIIKLVSKSASTGTSTYLNVVFSTLINRQILLDLNCSVDHFLIQQLVNLLSTTRFLTAFSNCHFTGSLFSIKLFLLLPLCKFINCEEWNDV